MASVQRAEPAHGRRLPIRVIFKRHLAQTSHCKRVQVALSEWPRQLSRRDLLVAASCDYQELAADGDQIRQLLDRRLTHREREPWHLWHSKTK